MPILGGRTERFSAQIMGGTAIRALTYSEKLKVVFGAGIGPNIGPNAERMEEVQRADAAPLPIVGIRSPKVSEGRTRSRERVRDPVGPPARAQAPEL